MVSVYSQDLFPTYLQQSKGFSSHDATVATIIGNLVSVLFQTSDSVQFATASSPNTYFDVRNRR